MNINAKEYFENKESRPVIAPSPKGGKLLVFVTMGKGTYPISNAKVSIFTEDGKQILTEITDESGRTDTVVLPTVPSSLSQSPGTLPDDTAVFYDIEIKAGGFLPVRIEHIPIYDGVTTIQKFDMTLLSAAPDDKSDIVVNPSDNDL